MFRPLLLGICINGVFQPLRETALVGLKSLTNELNWSFLMNLYIIIGGVDELLYPCLPEYFAF